jgi:hypothetical protein
VLHGNEVAVAEVSSGAVAARSAVVVGIELDEARSALAQQVEGEEPHLVLKLALHIGDERGAARMLERGDTGCSAARRAFRLGLTSLEQCNFCTKRGELLVVVVVASAKVVAETKEQQREEGGEKNWNGAASGHGDSKFGS